MECSLGWKVKGRNWETREASAVPSGERMLAETSSNPEKEVAR